MAKQRLINTRFWDDGFIRTLPAGDKLLFLYLLTNPCTTIAGAYEISVERMVFDTGMDMKRIESALKRLEEADRISYKEGWLLVHNFIKNQSLSSTILKGVEEAVKCCPNWIKDTISIRYDRLSHLNLNSNLNSNPNSNKKRKPPTTKFDPRFIEIFEEWKTALGKKSQPDLTRQGIILKRINTDKFSVDDLKLVPHGVLRSPWHCGANPDHQKFFEISTVYKNAEQVEKFVALAKIPLEAFNGNGHLPTAAENEKLQTIEGVKPPPNGRHNLTA